MRRPVRLPTNPAFSTHPFENETSPRQPFIHGQSLSTCHRDENFAVPPEENSLQTAAIGSASSGPRKWAGRSAQTIGLGKTRPVRMFRYRKSICTAAGSLAAALFDFSSVLGTAMGAGGLGLRSHFSPSRASDPMPFVKPSGSIRTSDFRSERIERTGGPLDFRSRSLNSSPKNGIRELLSIETLRPPTAQPTPPQQIRPATHTVSSVAPAHRR